MDADRRAQLESQLSAYIDGELSPSERQEVEAFLAEDADARRVLNELQATVTAVQSLPWATASEDLMAGLREQLERKALLEDDGRAGSFAAATSPWSGRWIAAAAVIALSLVAGYFVWSLSDDKSDTGSTGPSYVRNDEPAGERADVSAGEAPPTAPGASSLRRESGGVAEETSDVPAARSPSPAVAEPEDQKGAVADGTLAKDGPEGESRPGANGKKALTDSERPTAAPSRVPAEALADSDLHKSDAIGKAAGARGKHYGKQGEGYAAAQQAEPAPVFSRQLENLLQQEELARLIGDEAGRDEAQFAVIQLSFADRGRMEEAMRTLRDRYGFESAATPLESARIESHTRMLESRDTTERMGTTADQLGGQQLQTVEPGDDLSSDQRGTARKTGDATGAERAEDQQARSQTPSAADLRAAERLLYQQTEEHPEQTEPVDIPTLDVDVADQQALNELVSHVRYANQDARFEVLAGEELLVDRVQARQPAYQQGQVPADEAQTFESTLSQAQARSRRVAPVESDLSQTVGSLDDEPNQRASRPPARAGKSGPESAAKGEGPPAARSNQTAPAPSTSVFSEMDERVESSRKADLEEPDTRPALDTASPGLQMERAKALSTMPARDSVIANTRAMIGQATTRPSAQTGQEQIEQFLADVQSRPASTETALNVIQLRVRVRPTTDREVAGDLAEDQPQRRAAQIETEPPSAAEPASPDE